MANLVKSRIVPIIQGAPSHFKITTKRTRWLGQLFRKEELWPCRKLTFTNPDGTRKEGRPLVRRMDSIEEDLKQSGVKNSKTKTANRMELKSIVGTVTAGTRL
jgi:hypothetical protein